MDLDEIQQINREALRQAKSAYGGDDHDLFSGDMCSTRKLVVYAVAIAVGVASYFLLKKYQPSFVLTVQQGYKAFNQMRAIIASVAAGLLVLLVYYVYEKYSHSF